MSDQYKRSTDEEIGTSMERLNSLQVVTKHQRQVHYGGDSFITITRSPTAIPTGSQTETLSAAGSTELTQKAVSPSKEASLESIIQTEVPSVKVSKEPTQQTEAPSTSTLTENQQMEEKIVKVEQVTSSVKKTKSLVHVATKRPRVMTYRNSNHYMLEPGVILPHSGPSTLIIRSPVLFPTPQLLRTEGEDVTFTSQGT